MPVCELYTGGRETNRSVSYDAHNRIGNYAPSRLQLEHYSRQIASVANIFCQWSSNPVMYFA